MSSKKDKKEKSSSPEPSKKDKPADAKKDKATEPVSKKPSKSDLKKAKKDEEQKKKELQKAPSQKLDTPPPPADASSSSGNLPKAVSSSNLNASSSSSSSSSAAASSSSAAASSASSNPRASMAIEAASGGWTHHLALNPNLKQFADVTFTLADNQQAYAHSYVLEVRCPKLADYIPKKKLKKGDKKKWTPVTIDFSTLSISKITTLDKDTFTLILTFIYSDLHVINIAELEPGRVLKLAMAAKTFELQRLLKLCEDNLNSCLSMENVYPLLKCAHENQEKRIRDFCMDFAHKNIKIFVHERDKLKELGMELMQELVELTLEEYKPKPVDTTPVPDSSLIADFNRLYTGTVSADTFADGFVTLKNNRILFHKALLAAHAKSFAACIPPSGGNDEITENLFLRPPAKSHDKVVVFNLEPETFRAMLKFIYYGDNNFEPLVACNLASFLPKFQLTDLQQCCQHTISNNVKPDTVLDILRVAYLPEYASLEEIIALRETSLQFVAKHGKQINLDPLVNMEPNISVELLLCIQKQ